MYFPFCASYFRLQWLRLVLHVLWWASLNCVCLSVTTNGSHGLREPQLRRLGDASPHLHTHFIYPADRCLCLLATYIHTQNVAHFIIPALCNAPLPSTLLCFPKKQSKPLNSPPSPPLVCCLAVHTSDSLSLLLSSNLSQTSSLLRFHSTTSLFYCCLDLKKKKEEEYATKLYKQCLWW